MRLRIFVRGHICPLVRRLFRQSVHWSVCWSVRSSIGPSVCPSVRPLDRPWVGPWVGPSDGPMLFSNNENRDFWTWRNFKRQTTTTMKIMIMINEWQWSSRIWPRGTCLDMTTHLYKRLCLSICPLVCPSVRSKLFSKDENRGFWGRKMFKWNN